MFNANTKVLVVDDASTMRKIVIRCLKECGFTNFVEGADGNIAWSQIEAASPTIGLVVSDWNMPKCTGIDLLKKVRTDARFKDLPFLLLTAEAEARQIKEALAMNVDGYIIKPFTPEVLKKKIAEINAKLNSRAA